MPQLSFRWLTCIALFAMAALPRTADARERAQPAAVAKREVDGILFYGQSNAGAGGAAKPLLLQAVSPDRVFSFMSAQQTYGSKSVDPAHLTGLGPVRDNPSYAPFPATAMSYALTAISSSPAHAYFVHTIWYGGQPLTSFLPGTSTWSNLTGVVDGMVRALPESRWQRKIAALVLIQGESGPAGHDIYAKLLGRFLDLALPDIRQRTGQALLPTAILLQTNESNTTPAASAGVAQAQWDVARARARDTVLAGPMYQFPLTDAVHQSTAGRMMLGDLLREVFQRRLQEGEAFMPLHPIEAKRQGDVVTVTFQRPADALPLRWDEHWVPSVPDHGFSVRDETGGAVTITGVEITGPSEVTLRLSHSSFAHRLILQYAMTIAPAEGWAAKRGQLMAPTRIRSAFSDFGTGVPETISHYCIRFEMAVP